jgi:predicted esterase
MQFSAFLSASAILRFWSSFLETPMTETRTLSTAIQGRYLVEPAYQTSGGDTPLLVGFHGYAQNAEHLLEALRRIPGTAGWTLVAVQALHRFYSAKTREVVGSWMTSLDREQAIQDNLAYVARVVVELRAEWGQGPLVFAGFSQGAAMAWRAALHCGPCQGLVLLGGDLPGDVAEAAVLDLPPTLIGRGERDNLYTAPQLARDLAVLEARGFTPEVANFDGGHEWGPGFLTAVGHFLEKVQGRSCLA